MLELLLVLILIGVLLTAIERTGVVDGTWMWVVRVVVLIVVVIYLLRMLGLDVPVPRLR